MSDKVTEIEDILLEIFNDGFIFGSLARGKDDEESIRGKAQMILDIAVQD